MKVQAVAPAQQIRRTTAITTAAYVELDSALDKPVNGIYIASSMDQDLELAVGAASGEVTFFLIPAGNTLPYYQYVPIKLDQGVRLAAKAFTGDTTAGSLILNLFT